MSLKKVHLRKLLQIFYAPDPLRIKLLRADIREEIKKELSPEEEGGGDFYTPFWADAKDHAEGLLDLRKQTKVRIENNKGRERLYPRLTKGFINWFDEKRRWKNEEFAMLPKSVKNQYAVRELGCVVKVENILAARLTISQTNRLVYPYFSEEPVLGNEAGRLGLWVMGQALDDYAQEDMRVLDVLRSASFSNKDVPLIGNENELFLRRYEAALKERKKLRREYSSLEPA